MKCIFVLFLIALPSVTEDVYTPQQSRYMGGRNVCFIQLIELIHPVCCAIIFVMNDIG